MGEEGQEESAWDGLWFWKKGCIILCVIGTAFLVGGGINAALHCYVSAGTLAYARFMIGLFDKDINGGDLG